MSLHSILSPSSAHRRVRCVGSLAACKGIPNGNTVFAAEGTAYHLISSLSLELGRDCDSWVGSTVFIHDGSAWMSVVPGRVPEFTFEINETDAAHAQTYVDAIRRRSGTKLYEVRLDTSEVVGVDGQGGTGDAVTLDYENETIWVDDLKFGRGEVVYAEDNEQLMEYGAAAMIAYDMLADWKHVGVAIHQPRIGHYSEHVYTAEELRAWIAKIKPLEREAYRLWESGTADEIRSALTPSSKACRWCPISGNCTARANGILATFPVDALDDVPKWTLKMSDASLAEVLTAVEDWEAFLKAIRAEAHSRALAGATLPGWKLIEGRAGNRKWASETDAEAALLAVLKETEAYQPREIISVADADKMLNRKKHEAAAERIAAWRGMEKLVTQAPPSKSLVREGQRGAPVTIPKLEFPTA